MAAQLNSAGHLVTVFERADRIGGLLRYGIPEFKLEKRWLDRRLDLMQQEGVIFRTSCNVGVDVSADDLPREFRRGRPRRRLDGSLAICTVPGRELAGIHFAMDYLPLQNRRCEGDEIARRSLHHRREQARRDHRRRRHGRGLPGDGAPPGRRAA